MLNSSAYGTHPKPTQQAQATTGQITKMATEPITAAPELPPRQQLTRKFPLVGEQCADRILTQDSWQLTIRNGEEPDVRLSFSDIMAMPQTELTCDIHCVTRWSRVGDRLSGVLFKDLIAHLGIKPEGEFVRFIAYSVRDHDTSLPLSVCLEEGVMLVHQINGEPLTPEHGFPIRTFAPSRYFYKSLKWLREIRFLPEDKLGFWERGGYHNNADYTLEERYVTGNLTEQELTKLRKSRDFTKYQGQVLLSLDLSELDLRGADLSGVQLKNCTLDGCQLQGANLRAANLSNSSLLNADLEGADLTEADLDGVLFMGANLKQAQLREALLNATEFARAGFAPAQVVEMDFSGAQIDGLIESQLYFLQENGAVTTSA